MHLSSDRILTTHTGSLPRPACSLTGPERDAEQLADAVRSVVTSQIDAGVDVVNDGEASKVGYSTYVTERLTGFGGEGEPLRPKDYDDFPAWGERMMSERARARRLTNPACIGPVAYEDTSLVQADIDNLKQATAGQDVTEVFMSAASPGVIAVFLANKYYPSDEEYIGALADAMKTEYDAIHAAGLLLQLDCPDLAMGWNVSSIGGTQEGFLVEVGRRVAAINHATRDIPPEAMRLHLCWGNYEGPHTRDIPLRSDHRRGAQGPACRDLVRGRQPPPRARVERVRGRQAARRQGHRPWRDRLDDQLRGAPGTGRAADRALRGPGRPGERPGQQRLRVRHVRQLVHGRAARDLGEAGGDGRGSPAGEPGALGLTASALLPARRPALPGARAVGRCSSLLWSQETTRVGSTT